MDSSSASRSERSAGTADSAPEPFAEEIARLSDTILASERLSLLSARGLTHCAIPYDGKGITFAPGIGSSMLIKPEPRQHRTTSAQCVAALQSLLPVMGRFQLGTHESKGLAFHPIERSAAKDFKLEDLSATVRDNIVGGLEALGTRPPPPAEGFPASFHDHPFRAALILRATTPSKLLFTEIWWRSLFIVVWYLHQRSGHRRGMPNIQATTSPGTAFLTSRCVDAIETVLMVFRRRSDRFERLIGLLLDLGKTRDERKWLDAPATRRIIPKEHPHEPIVHAGYRYRTSILIPEARACLEELACDSALPELYKRWLKTLKSLGKDRAQTTQEFKSAEEFLEEVSSSLVSSLERKKAAREADRARKQAERIVRSFKLQVENVRAIHDRIASNRARAATISPDLPSWICSADYRQATKSALKARGPRELHDALESHWARHRDAAEHALRTVEQFKTYLLVALDRLSGLGASRPRLTVDRFLSNCKDQKIGLPAIRNRLQHDMETGARWAEILLNRHLAFATSGAVAQFDPSELAHALKVVCRDGGRVRFAIILKALQTVCAAQRPDGTWNCEQPFFWTENGSAMTPMSIEIALAVVSAVSALVMNPERYGASQVEIATGL